MDFYLRTDNLFQIFLQTICAYCSVNKYIRANIPARYVFHYWSLHGFGLGRRKGSRLDCTQSQWLFTDNAGKAFRDAAALKENE